MMRDAEANPATRPRDLRTRLSENHVLSVGASIDDGKFSQKGDLSGDRSI
jgi:hypothetical protein